MDRSNIKLTAMREILRMIDNNEIIMPNTKKWLIELEKLQMIQAYQLDPELMKIRYKDGQEWFKDTYGM